MIFVQVTHELLGTVKVCHGEIELLKDKLAKVPCVVSFKETRMLFG